MPPTAIDERPPTIVECTCPTNFGFCRDKCRPCRIGVSRRPAGAIFDPMPNYCLETTNLSHQWNARTPVLHAINLRVPKDSVYGFLGPNGAGKTTTLKLILGLLKKQQGEIHVFGHNWEGHRLEILHRIGSLIESPSLYAQLTASENLRVLQRVYRCPKSRIDEVLTLTRLTDTGRKKAGKFSFGMETYKKQFMQLLNR